MSDPHKRRRPAPRPAAPMVRRGTVRLPTDVAARVRAGHPWVYREILGGRPLREKSGDVVELLDPAGEFVGRGIYEEDASIAVRVMTRRPAEQVTPDLFARRVREAVAFRQRLGIGGDLAHRVINAESDGVPAVTVDRYGDYLVTHFFSAATIPYREALLDALEQSLRPKAIYEQRRLKSLAGEAPRGAELVRGSPAPVELEAGDGPLRFWVDVTAPLSTGLFLDLREGRKAVGQWASGRRVLNLFSYTGAISVWAQHGGAVSVTAVDVAAKAHARARRNFSLNGFDPEKPEHIVGDAFKVLAKFAERKRRFDLIVLDPPAFGTSGRGQVFAAAQDYRDLVAASLAVLDPGGILVAASSTHKISPEDFDRMLAEGAAKAQSQLRIIERRGLPADFCTGAGFPEGSYLKVAVAVKD
jgi:23S rRNA (cytosine1962-C5)-methyltransferase